MKTPPIVLICITDRTVDRMTMTSLAADIQPNTMFYHLKGPYRALVCHHQSQLSAGALKQLTSLNEPFHLHNRYCGNSRAPSKKHLEIQLHTSASQAFAGITHFHLRLFDIMLNI
jgi:hypothetical protein